MTHYVEEPKFTENGVDLNSRYLITCWPSDGDVICFTAPNDHWDCLYMPFIVNLTNKPWTVSKKDEEICYVVSYVNGSFCSHDSQFTLKPHSYVCLSYSSMEGYSFSVDLTLSDGTNSYDITLSSNGPAILKNDGPFLANGDQLPPCTGKGLYPGNVLIIQPTIISISRSSSSGMSW